MYQMASDLWAILARRSRNRPETRLESLWQLAEKLRGFWQASTGKRSISDLDAAVQNSPTYARLRTLRQPFQARSAPPV